MPKTRIVYLPGIDGIPDAGDRLFEYFPDCSCEQASYPKELAGSLSDMGDWVIKHFLREDLQAPVLIGESYGAALAQEVLSKAPGTCASAIFLAGFTSHPRPKLGSALAFAMRYLPKWLLLLPLRMAAKPLLLQRTNKDQRERFYEMLAGLDLKVMAKRINSLRRFDSRTHQDSMLPKLWIWGEADTLMNHHEERRWLRDNRASDKAVIIAEAGHVLIRTQAETLVMHIRRFLRLPADCPPATNAE